MKKFKIPARVLAIVRIALFSIVLIGSFITLPLMIIEITSEYDMWIYILGVLTLALSASVVSSIFGYEWAKMKVKGRPMRFQDFAYPGTVLPQSQSLFYYRGKHELGNGWVVAVFQKIRVKHPITGIPGVTSVPIEVLQRDLFCVLMRGEVIPRNPCFFRVEYDQQKRLNAVMIPEQKLGMN